MTHRWTDGLMDGWTNDVAFAHPYHVGKSCSKFGEVRPSGLEGR